MKRCWLYPCPGCGENKSADEGHHLCRQCEGYEAPSPTTDPLPYDEFLPYDYNTKRVLYHLVTCYQEWRNTNLGVPNEFTDHAVRAGEQHLRDIGFWPAEPPARSTDFGVPQPNEPTTNLLHPEVRGVVAGLRWLLRGRRETAPTPVPLPYEGDKP